MKVGKLPESVLDRCVFKQLHKNNDKILCKPAVGVGFQLLDVCDSQVMATTSNVVQGTAHLVGELVVPRAVNSIVCSGAEICGVMLTLILPESLEEWEFKVMMRRINELCDAAGISLMGGHTQVSAGIAEVFASVTAYGLYDDLQIVKEGRRSKEYLAQPGQDIIMTKWAGLSGSWLLEKKYHQEFSRKYNPDIAESISRMKDYFSVQNEARLALEYGARTLFDLSEGGVFGGLWEVAAAGNVGLQVDLKKIPLKQETVELCDFVDINPYQLVSMGSLLIAADHGELLVHKLNEENIAAVIIGHFTDNNDRVIINDDEVRYLEPPRTEKFI